MSASPQFSQQDRFMHNAQVKTISDINSLTKEMISVTDRTIGEFVVSKNGWSYEGCLNCTKGVEVVKGSFKCQYGHFSEHSVPGLSSFIIVNYDNNFVMNHCLNL